MIRLRQFSLNLFGHFSGKGFDFGETRADRPDFHVIYGPNEAGKTTTMEGLLRLLYGFPHRDPYDFLHQRKNLKVSGVLEIDGQPHALTRLPTRTGSLLDGNGTALPEAILQAHLGGLSEPDYRQLLCLDDETIERGGEEIASSKGDIGRLLFSAAAGVSDLTEVLDQLRAKADSLYRKRASTTEMARLKKELAEVEKHIKEQDIPASAYRKLKHALETALADEASVRAERAALHLQKAEIDSLQSALPKLAAIDDLDRSLAPFADYPKRLDFNPEDLVGLLSRQTQLHADETRLEDEIVRLEGQLTQITRNPDYLSILDDLDRLDELKSRYATAELDLGKRRKTLLDIQDDMTRAAADLEVPEGTDLHKLVLSQAQIRQLESARDELRTATREASSQELELLAATTRLKEAEAQLSRIEAPKALIGPILQRFSVDDLAPRFASASQAIKGASDRLSNALAELNLKGQVFDAPPTPTLSADEADDLAERHRAARDRLEQAKEEQDSRLLKIEILMQKIAHLKEATGLIDDDQSKAEMAKRDLLWEHHKASLSASTAADFEQAMHSVDGTATARLTQARELGQLRHEEQALVELQTQLTFDARTITDLRQEIANIEGTVSDQAKAAGLMAEITPASFATWVQRCDVASQASLTLERAKQEHGKTLDAASRLIDGLRSQLALDTDDFETVVTQARKREADERATADTFKAALKSRDDQQTEVERREERLLALQKTAQSRREHWETLVADLFSGALDPDMVLLSLDPLRILRELDVRRLSAERQVNAMADDQEDFGRQVAALAKTYNAETKPAPLETFKSLSDLGKAAQEAETQFETLSAALSVARDNLKTAQGALKEIELRVSNLAAVFPANVPTQTLVELRSAVRDAQDVIEKRTQRAQLGTAVCTDLNVPDLDEARARLSGAAASDLAAQAMTLQDDLDTVEKRLETAIEERTSAQKDLNAVTADADVAALTERRATLEAQIEDTALRYLQTDFGLRLAEEAIRRYRDSHRSNMMEATEKAFAELTNGAYTRLTTQQSDVLVALDAAGMAKQAQDMSKGTRFQLYLALRAAAYEQLAGQGVCLPFFCDDIFETFDEDRTRSACRVLERIGKTGQAIYLTHHRHVVEIAQEVCPNGVMVHEI